MDSCRREDAATGAPSAFPEFAEIFSFLNKFGSLLSLPPVSLTDLESFFSGGYNQQQSAAVHCHWTLLAHVTKKDSEEEWQRMAVRFGRKQGLFSETCMYCDLSLEQRMKIFKLACECQFDTNVTLREKLAQSSSDLQMKPIGYDRDGQRHWFFKDFFGDLRLYAEREYDEFPPDDGVWCLVCRSHEDLTRYIATLESRTLCPPHLNQCPSSMHDLCDRAETSHLSADLHLSDKRPGNQKKVQRQKKRKKNSSSEVTEKAGGCIRCHQDTDYSQLLLCDVCNSECHTYCQYPVLWSIPQGTWICPLCSEWALVENLKVEHSLLLEMRALQEEAVEKTKRNAVRLQRSGMLVQNIIDEEGSAGRSRRTRKAIDYASLNDIYLPPLGPQDYVSAEGYEVISTQSIPVRQSRRLKGNKTGQTATFEEHPTEITVEHGQGAYEEHPAETTITSQEHRQGTYEEHSTEKTIRSQEHGQGAYEEHPTEKTIRSQEHGQGAYEGHPAETTITSQEHRQGTYEEHLASNRQITSDGQTTNTCENCVTIGCTDVEMSQSLNSIGTVKHDCSSPTHLSLDRVPAHALCYTTEETKQSPDISVQLLCTPQL